MSLNHGDNGFIEVTIGEKVLPLLEPYIFVKSFLPQQGGVAKPKKGSLEALTIAELREKCKSRRIAYSGLRKAELIVALRAGRKK